MLARLLVPICAVAILFFGAGIQPILRHNERELVQSYIPLSIDHNDPLNGEHIDRRLDQVKKEVLVVAAQLDIE